MSVKIGSARIDENGKAHGGAAGDQTGKEVSTQSWYAHTKGWVLLRAKSAEARERIARCMQAACDNKHVGYDQYQRDTLYNDAKQYGFDVSKVTKDVETDCSALVRVCVNYAGISVGSFRTTNQASVLMATGAFEKFTDDAHTKKSANLLRGDILVTKTQGHTVVVLSDGSNAAKERAGDPGTDAAKPGVIAKGAEGADVAAMQKALAALGYDLGPYGIDGDFGEDTDAALREFQKKAGLDQTGIYDEKTREALMAAIDPKGTADPGTDAAPENPGKQVEVTGLNVNIRKGNGTQYGRIVILPYGTKLPYVATADNGWFAVVVNEQVGWISGNFSKVI